MPTNTAGSKALAYYTQQTHYLMALAAYTDGDGKIYTLGTVPANSLIKKGGSGVHVTTAFNAGTTNTMDIGTSGSPTLLGSALSLTTTTFVPTAQAVGGYYVTQDTVIQARLNLSGTAASAGAAVILLEYCPLNPGQ